MKSFLATCILVFAGCPRKAEHKQGDPMIDQAQAPDPTPGAPGQPAPGQPAPGQPAPGQPAPGPTPSVPPDQTPNQAPAPGAGDAGIPASPGLDGGVPFDAGGTDDA